MGCAVSQPEPVETAPGKKLQQRQFEAALFDKSDGRSYSDGLLAESLSQTASSDGIPAGFQPSSHTRIKSKSYSAGQPMPMQANPLFFHHSSRVSQATEEFTASDVATRSQSRHDSPLSMTMSSEATAPKHVTALNDQTPLSRTGTLSKVRLKPLTNTHFHNTVHNNDNTRENASPCKSAPSPPDPSPAVSSMTITSRPSPTNYDSPICPIVRFTNENPSPLSTPTGATPPSWLSPSGQGNLNLPGTMTDQNTIGSPVQSGRGFIRFNLVTPEEKPGSMASPVSFQLYEGPFTPSPMQSTTDDSASDTIPTPAAAPRAPRTGAALRLNAQRRLSMVIAKLPTKVPGVSSGAGGTSESNGCDPHPFFPSQESNEGRRTHSRTGTSQSTSRNIQEPSNTDDAPSSWRGGDSSLQPGMYDGGAGVHTMQFGSIVQKTPEDAFLRISNASDMSDLVPLDQLMGTDPMIERRLQEMALNRGEHTPGADGPPPEQDSAHSVASQSSSRCFESMTSRKFRSHLERMLLTHSYTMGYRLNSGVSAEVFTVTETATQAVFAAKVYFKCDRNSIIEACTEQVCMTRANSPHVLACCGFYMHRGRPCLVLELARMSLRDFLEALHSKREIEAARDIALKQIRHRAQSLPVVRQQQSDASRSNSTGAITPSLSLDETTAVQQHPHTPSATSPPYSIAGQQFDYNSNSDSQRSLNRVAPSETLNSCASGNHSPPVSPLHHRVNSNNSNSSNVFHSETSPGNLSSSPSRQQPRMESPRFHPAMPPLLEAVQCSVSATNKDANVAIGLDAIVATSVTSPSRLHTVAERSGNVSYDKSSLSCEFNQQPTRPCLSDPTDVKAMSEYNMEQASRLERHVTYSTLTAPDVAPTLEEIQMIELIETTEQEPIGGLSMNGECREWVNAGLPLIELLYIIGSMIEAILDVHVAGLAHCDLKPENIMMMEDGSVKLADFGAAVAINPDTGELSATPLMMEIDDLVEQRLQDSNLAVMQVTAYSKRLVTQCTAAYAAPEMGNDADLRKVDVWSLGCIAYELCSGGERVFSTNEMQKWAQLAQINDNWKCPRLPSHASSLQELVDAMLSVRVSLRPLPADLLKFPLLRQIYQQGNSRNRTRRVSVLTPTSSQHKSTGQMDVRMKKRATIQ